MPFIILNCSCQHKFQDENYGKGKRVHNIITKQDKSARYTVCTNINFTGIK